MVINDVKVVGDSFAYDGCHKIYIIESDEDRMEATRIGYEVFPIDELEDAYYSSCGLEFISNWSLDKSYVGQFEDAHFDY